MCWDYKFIFMQIKLTFILDSKTRFEADAQGNPKMTNSSKASSIRSPLTENTRDCQVLKPRTFGLLYMKEEAFWVENLYVN